MSGPVTGSRPSGRFWYWLALSGCVFGGSSTGFAAKELRVKVLPETPLPYVTTVTAPLARHVAVSEPAKMMVIGHRPKHPVHLSFYRLDDQGLVIAGEPVSIMLPKPAALVSNPNWALGILCHPHLPLVYVWQDVEPLTGNLPVEGPSVAEFDHLLIYSLAEPEPKLLLATARGPEYASGNLVGGFALNAAATRLYVPSMQQFDVATKKFVTGVGWLVLDPDGLPPFDSVDAPVEVSLAAAPAVPTPDAATATAAQAAKMAAIEAGKAAGKPLTPRRYLETAWTFSGQPSPYCYAPLNDDIVFAASHSGPTYWILTDRLGRFGYHYVQPYVPFRYRVTAHPTAPSVYVTPVIYDGRMMRIEHADGYFTLVPQTLLLDNIVYHSTPILLTKTNQLVVGANGRICLIDLEADGRFKAAAVQMTVNNPTVEGIAWSEKFGRLFVPVEKLP